jgi:uncharacterized protein
VIRSHIVDVGALLAGSGREIAVDDEVALEPFEGFDFPRPASVHLEVRYADRLLAVRGRISVEAHGWCDRCLEEVTSPLGIDVDERLDPEAGREVDPFGESNVLTGHRLDVADLAQQLVLSILPLGVRCKEDCLGLCPICGANLNTSGCSCDDGEIRG